MNQIRANSCGLLALLWYTSFLWCGCTYNHVIQGAADAGGFDQTSSQMDGHVDGKDITLGCIPWSATSSFKTPVLVQEISTPQHEAAPYLTSDGLTIYYASYHIVDNKKFEVYVATRNTRDAMFGNPVRYDTIGSVYDETRFALSNDGLTVYLATTRPGSAGGSDIWISTRANTSVSFSNGHFTPLDIVNSPGDEYAPFPSSDELKLYFAVASADKNGVYVSKRADRKQSFASPVALTEVNSSFKDGSPALTSNELLIVFSSERPGVGGSDLWYATRSDSGLPFSAPQLVPNVNTTYYEGEVYVTLDGCEIFFISDRPGGVGARDVYRAQVDQ